MSESEKKVADGGAKKKPSTSTIIAIVAVIVILILVAVIVYILFGKKDEPDVQGKATFITEENAQDIIESANQPTEDSAYTATMTNEWTFENGKASAENFYVKNTENNSRTVYFDLALDDTGEVIYSSPYLEVGAEMNAMTLDKDLEAGDYRAIMTYHLVDDEQEELTTVAVAVVIHILN